MPRPFTVMNYFTAATKHSCRRWRVLVPACLVWLMGANMALPGTVARRPMQSGGHVPAAAARLKPTGGLPETRRLHLAIGLPLRNQLELDRLLGQLQDPASPNFRRYLTPGQFTERFGPTEEDYQALMEFALANGLTVTTRHPNRMVLNVDGTAGDIAKTFHLNLQVFRHPTEARDFYAPDSEPTADCAVELLHVCGLDNYAIPRPSSAARPAAASAQPTPNGGSGPSGTYRGTDFRKAYAPDTSLTGTGQSVGLLQFDGFYASDIATYVSQTGLPGVPLTVVPVDGGVSTPGSGNSEVALDIEMAISMAPGLAGVYVYEAPNTSPWVNLLNRMATDNLARQLSCSWTVTGQNPTAEQIFKQMAAQGQSFFTASGDSDAYTGAIPFPADSPNITVVGGTTLTTGSNASYSSETVWNWGNGTGSSGGISTNYSIPSYQQGLSMSANQGSTTLRNVPDVALTADKVYVVYDNGSTDTFGGTSCAAPLWAAFAALVNQQAAAAGRGPIGFINPAIYAIGQSGSYGSCFHDITSGNNFSGSSPALFSAVSGYDLCTGWGTPRGQATINVLAGYAPALSAVTLQKTYDGTTTATAANLSIVGSPANVSLAGSIAGGLAGATVGAQSATLTYVAAPRQTASVSQGNGTATVTLGSTPLMGNTLIAIGVAQDWAGPNSITFSSGGVTWTPAVQMSGNSSCYPQLEIWYAPVTTATAGVVVTVSTRGNVVATVSEFQGIWLGAPVDQKPTTYGDHSPAGATVSGGTTAQANELWIGAVGIECKSSPDRNMTSIPSGFTGLGTNLQGWVASTSQQIDLDSYYKVVTTQGTATMTLGSVSGWTNSTNVYQLALVTFRAGNLGSLVLQGAAARNYTLDGVNSVTVIKGTPTVNTWPSANTIAYGQTLVSANLSGGSATTPGTFDWTTPTMVPDIGTTAQSVTFTPADSTNYTPTAGNVYITVTRPAGTYTWNTASGTWNTAGNWLNSLAANNTLAPDGSYYGDSILLANGGTLDLGGATQSSVNVGAADNPVVGAIQNGTLSFSGSLYGNSGTVSAMLAGTGSLTKSGSGTLILTATNTYGGGTTISSGTLKAGAANAMGGSAVSVASGATWDLGVDSHTVTGLSGAGNITRSNVLATGADGATQISNGRNYVQKLDFGNGAGASVNGVAFDSVGTSGTGWSLAGASILYGESSATGYDQMVSDFCYGGNPGVLTFTGLTVGQIYHAVLYTKIGWWPGRPQNATFAHGSDSQQLPGTNPDTVGYYSYKFLAGNTTATITMSPIGAGTFHWFGASLENMGAPSRTLTVGDSNNHLFSGVISGWGALTKAGSGTLTLSGANTYSGGTTVSAGTLNLGDGSVSNGSVAGNITNNSNLSFANPNAQTYAGVISGTGSMTKSGSGTLTLAGANSYTGSTTVSQGGLILGSTGGLTFKPTTNGVSNKVTGTGSVTLDGGFTINLLAADPTPGNSWTLVDVTTVAATFGPHFHVVDFTETSPGSGVFSKGSGDTIWAFSKATGKLTHTAGYASWAITHGLTGTPGASLDPAFAADPNKDGIQNGMAWILGADALGNPAANRLKLPAVSRNGTGAMILTFDRLASSAASAPLFVQYGNTPGGSAWTAVTVGPNAGTTGDGHISIAVAPGAGSNANYDRITVTIPAAYMAAHPRTFTRLMATQNP